MTGCVAAVAVHGSLLGRRRAASTPRRCAVDGRVGVGVGVGGLGAGAASLPRPVNLLAQVCGHGVRGRHLYRGLFGVFGGVCVVRPSRVVECVSL